MTIEAAREKILATMNGHAEKFKNLGFITTVRTYYTDKSLGETDTLTRSAETLWCDLLISSENMSDGDGLLYSLYADIDKDGINIKEPVENEEAITSALNELYATLSEAESPTERFMEEYEHATAKYASEIKLLEKRLNRLKYLSYAAVGITVITIFIIFVLSL